MIAGERILALLFGLALAGGLAPRAGAAPPSGEAGEDPLLMELRLDQVVLADGFPALQRGQALLLPLGELCRNLELAIQVDPVQRTARGFLIEEGRRFELDLRRGTVTVGGLTRPLDRTLLEAQEEDLYLDTRLLAQCLPLDFDLSLRGSRITVKPRETLPLQASWKRQGAPGPALGGPVAEPFPLAKDPYAWAELPAVDLTLGAQGAHNTPTLFQGTLLAAGDFLDLSSRLYVQAQSRRGLTQFRMTLGRKDPRGGLLGPLRATEFALGEVLDPGLDLMTEPMAGTGLRVTNLPANVGNAYDRHSFQGDLAPGWQVELYQNQALVGFQAARPDGTYAFLNVPLFFGRNDFKLVFYGPQGQRRVEPLRLEVNQNQTPAGAFHYEATALKPHGPTEARGQFRLSYGLTDRLTATFGAASAPRGGVAHQFLTAGLLGFWEPVAGSLTLARDTQGGTVAEGVLRKRLGALSLGVKHTELAGGFTSEVFDTTLPGLKRRTTLEGSAGLPNPEQSKVLLDFSWYRDQAASGSADTATARLTTSLSGFALSSQILRTLTRSLGQPVRGSTSGAFLASRIFSGFALRGQASYRLSGARALENLTLAADTFAFAPYTVQASLSRSLASRDTVAGLALNKAQGATSLSAALSYSTVSRLAFNLSFRLGFTRDPRQRRLVLGSGNTSYGAASALAFLDTNGNGLRDPGEAPLPDVAVEVNGSRQVQVTDAKGLTFLGSLPQGAGVNLSLDPSTLESPLMHPGTPGSRLIPRGGHVAQVDLPVVLHSEVNGTTYRLASGKRTEAPGLRLELRDGQDRLVRSLRSAYDGFFSFTNLPPGAYKLAIVPGGALPPGATLPPPRTLDLSPQGTMLDGVDFTVPLPSPEVQP